MFANNYSLRHNDWFLGTRSTESLWKAQKCGDGWWMKLVREESIREREY